MSSNKLSPWFQNLQKKYPDYIKSLDELGTAIRQEGPPDDKTAHLIQLAEAAANRSEGAVHSHTRLLLDLGTNHEKINHAIILLTSTNGFPAVSAALSWMNDIPGEQ